MKRISKIQIENYRGYYDQLSFSLNNGENLLLYGENGSGKTSLYKAMNDFIQSFYSHVSYIPNRYMMRGAPGKIALSIGDYNRGSAVTNVVEYNFADGTDNTQMAGVSFMKALALSKGFLNYRDLMMVYLYDEDNPNLFDFFVLHLLGNHVPLAQGSSISLNESWKELNNNLFKVYNRKENKHKKGKRQLADFETILRSLLTNLFTCVNRFLRNYFVNFDLSIDYKLDPMVFHYKTRKSDWEINTDLRLIIKIDNSVIVDYTDGLNEARLSAIAICLYLAALRLNPGQDLRFMFLDDIFIGLDSANRLPIIKILVTEFVDFQIVITTYDRSWYCLAKNYLSKHNPNEWKFANLFCLPKNIGSNKFVVPVLTDSKSSYDQAKEYLHGQRDIDLPASANYFRKALEEIFNDSLLPKELFLVDDYIELPGYRVSKRVETIRKLFLQIGEDPTEIIIIDTYLHALIHPLSHFEEEAQIYRTELIEVEKAIPKLAKQIQKLPSICKLLLGKGNKVVINYKTADGSYLAKYNILLEENLWLFKDNNGLPKFTDCRCRACYMEGTKNGVPLRPYSPKPTQLQFNYKSIDDALQKIYDYEINNLGNNVLPHRDYDIVDRYINKSNYEPIVQRRNNLLATM